jgi:hypothetical protein
LLEQLAERLLVEHREQRSLVRAARVPDLLAALAAALAALLWLVVVVLLLVIMELLRVVAVAVP